MPLQVKVKMRELWAKRALGGKRRIGNLSFSFTYFNHDRDMCVCLLVAR